MERRWRHVVLWVAALALAGAGAVWYLVSQSHLAWWLGGAAAIPLIWLILDREERVAGDEPHKQGGGWSDGPWGPP